jgi:diaminohydroxyphosphoribosylaminopyrimidine deaminase / 5-amino-6-(5-phosphoribosylamino)uracil reductase
MRRALELARRGRAGTHPNPMVGAVIVHGGSVIGEGWHAEYGGPHAEVEAIRAAGDAARGATLYVTLEPCAHHGKTPPCTDALLAAGVSRVVFAAEDPTVEAGGGAAVLRAAGVDVTGGVERDAARSLNIAFFRLHERGAPYVALKLAISLDGRIAAAPGRRTDITGSAAREETHRLRAAHDAILVGAGTVRADDPLLTVRGVARPGPGPPRQPVRVVLDTRATLDPASRLAATARETPTWVVCGEDAEERRTGRLEAAGVRVVRAPVRGALLDLRAVLAQLAAEGLRAIFVEGGAAVATGLLAAGLADRLYLFVAPSFLGHGGVPAFALDRPLTGWRHAAADRHGADLLLTLDPAPAPAEHGC